MIISHIPLKSGPDLRVILKHFSARGSAFVLQGIWEQINQWKLLYCGHRNNLHSYFRQQIDFD